jgi:hypothetical protein
MTLEITLTFALSQIGYPDGNRLQLAEAARSVAANDRFPRVLKALFCVILTYVLSGDGFV